MVTVVVADDERVFAEALTSLLGSDAELRVLPALSSLEEVEQVVAAEAPDVAILSNTLGSKDGATPVPSWAGTKGATRVLLVGADKDVEVVSHAMQSGASGWVAKNASADELVRAVRTVARGDVHLPPDLITSVVRVLADSGQVRGGRRGLDALTHREREVLGCMVRGLNRDEIARSLFLSPNTVRTHMQHVLRKLGVHSSIAAAAYARQYGVTGAERTWNVGRPVASGPARTAGPATGCDSGRLRNDQEGAGWISTMR
jgi:DNA-binding NarL/FixJ family response regulator